VARANTLCKFLFELTSVSNFVAVGLFAQTLRAIFLLNAIALFVRPHFVFVALKAHLLCDQCLRGIAGLCKWC